MKRLLLASFILISLVVAEAQNDAPSVDARVDRGLPAAAARKAQDLNATSSSFVPDPDPLDPLPVRSENLKDDAEPVLDDIRQVIDAPSTKKRKSTKKKSSVSKSVAKSGGKSKRKKKKVTESESTDESGRNADDPDLKIEESFHKTFEKYNSEPTSVSGWQNVVTGKDSQVYTVQKKDTLWSISKTLFGDPNFWPKIWAINKMGIENPHQINPGLKVVFAAGSSDQAPAFAIQSEVDDSGEGVAVTTPAGDIPQSIPNYSDDILARPSSLDISAITKEPVTDDTYPKDIILTDTEVTPEAKFEMTEIMKGRCGGDQVLKTTGISAGTNFEILEPMDTLKTDVGNVLSYRIIGHAKAISDTGVKVDRCYTVASKYLVFVTPGNLSSYKTSKVSSVTTPTIIGGPNIGSQQFFTDHQIAYVNVGSANVAVGQKLKVKSQFTERISGEILVLEKFGSFIVGAVTKVTDVVESGDEVVF